MRLAAQRGDLCALTLPARRIDKAEATALSPGVSTARRIAALLLLALWLPAMLHCRLEAAGLLHASDCCSTTTCAPQPATAEGCADDSCDVAEGEFTAPASFILKAPPSDQLASLLVPPALLLPAPLMPAPATGVAEATNAPPELTLPWVLVARGPLSPRAP